MIPSPRKRGDARSSRRNSFATRVMEFHVLYFQDTYSERTCIGTGYVCLPKNERVIYRLAERRWGAVEGVKRSRNDFPSFFLNHVRFIDAPDRNGAINLVVSISIMAILREENESANARGDDWGVEGGREGEPDERITFSSLAESYGTDCGSRVPRASIQTKINVGERAIFHFGPDGFTRIASLPSALPGIVHG